jgi:CRISPR system Cascade subunit CasE
MYLSQLTLNPRSRQILSERNDPYQMHRTLCRAWTNRSTPDTGKEVLREARPLYRLDETPAGDLFLLVQSQLEPDWSFLDGGGYLMKAPQTKPFSPQLQAGQVLSFRLRANPTKCAVAPGQKTGRGKRTGIFKEAERRDWLLRQAARCGFSIPIVGELEDGTPVYDLRITDEKAIRASPEGPGKSTQAVLSSALFEGRLVVGDADAFAHALQNGIGAGKAFGFGLLSLRRA